MFHGAVLAQDSSLGDGKIDNWIIDSSVHVTVGVLAVLSLTASAVWLTRLAWRGATLRRRVPEAAELSSRPVFALLYVLGLVVMVLQFANALGVGVQQSVWWYLVGLTWLLASVCVLFFLSVRAWARAA